MQSPCHPLVRWRASKSNLLATGRYRAKHHVIVHHDNGTSFGADFFFDPVRGGRSQVLSGDVFRGGGGG